MPIQKKLDLTSTLWRDVKEAVPTDQANAMMACLAQTNCSLHQFFKREL